MVNSVGFVIVEEDLTLGPGTRLNHSRDLYSRVLLKQEKGQRKLLTQTSEGGQRVPPLIVLARELYTF